MAVTYKTKTTKAEPKAAEPKTYFIQKVIGGDTYMVKAQTAVELEDEYLNLYYTSQSPTNVYIQPPFEPGALLRLANTNNTLNQCIEAMEVNVDSTGHEFVPVVTGDKEDQDEVDQAKGIFDQPCPGESMITIRRKLRRSMEAVGYGFLEVLRNMKGDVVGWRNIETHTVRLVKLDAPVLVTTEVERNGKPVQMRMWVRQRRFVQRIALSQFVYYKEFGVERDVDRTSGEWAKDGQKIDADKAGTELLIVGVHPDINTSYYLPRWINQMPSVVGSRKAEEQNLEFLDSGGMPPAIIFVQGGTLAKDASDQLRMYLSGQNKNKNRAVVVEAMSNSGQIDAAGTVKVTVERFGAEQAKDAMFMKYDQATAEHVRESFRIAPIFLGKAADYNFATAVTAYMVTEAQVFQPERQAFDEIINMTIMKALKFKTIKFKSLPITLQNVENQLKAMALVKDVATRDSFLEATNKMTGLSLDLAPEPQPDTVTMTDPTTGATTFPSGRTAPGQPQPLPQAPPPQRGVDASKPEFKNPLPQQALPGGGQPGNVKQMPKPGAPKPAAPKQKKTAVEVVELAYDYCAMRGTARKAEFTPEMQRVILAEVESLTDDDLIAFNTFVAQQTFASVDPDLLTLTERALNA